MKLVRSSQPIWHNKRDPANQIRHRKFPWACNLHLLNLLFKNNESTQKCLVPPTGGFTNRAHHFVKPRGPKINCQNCSYCKNNSPLSLSQTPQPKTPTNIKTPQGRTTNTPQQKTTRTPQPRTLIKPLSSNQTTKIQTSKC